MAAAEESAQHAPLPCIEGRGASPKWAQHQQNVKRIFNLYRIHHPDATKIAYKDWDELPEEVLCTTDSKLYGSFVAYLLETYVIETGPNKGKHLLVSNVCNYFGTLLNLAKVKFESTGSAQTKLFFTCLAPKAGTAPWNWYKGMKQRIERICFQRAMEAGEKILKTNKQKGDRGGGQAPVYLHHFISMNKALATEGSAESAHRKFELISLWQSAGRSSEVPFLFTRTPAISPRS